LTRKGAIPLLTLTTLASGSSGNCLLVSDGRTHILVDAGISARRITTHLNNMGVAPGELAGILVTHEHSDHIAGLATLTKQFSVPIFTTAATGRQLCRRAAWIADRIHTVVPGTGFSLGGLDAAAFSTPHDAADSVGFTVSAQGRTAAVVTDLGRVTEEVLSAVSGAQLAVLECNYEPEWLRSGPYPYPLKVRISGGRGHLSNGEGAQLACILARSGASRLVLAHLSRENNTPARALDTVCRALEEDGIQPEDVAVTVAPRDCPGRPLCV